MARAEGVATTYPSSCVRRSSCSYSCSAFLVPHSILRFSRTRKLSGPADSNVLIGLHLVKRGDRLRKWRSKVATTGRVLENPPETRATVEIPLTCYQVIVIFFFLLGFIVQYTRKIELGSIVIIFLFICLTLGWLGYMDFCTT